MVAVAAVAASAWPHRTDSLHGDGGGGDGDVYVSASSHHCTVKQVFLY